MPQAEPEWRQLWCQITGGQAESCGTNVAPTDAKERAMCPLRGRDNRCYLCLWRRTDRETGGEDLPNCETGHELSAVARKKMNVNA
jgi:hypothetical protein